MGDVPNSPNTPCSDLLDSVISPIRLQDVKQSYFSGAIDHDTAISFYPDWVKQPLYLVRVRADHDQFPTNRPVTGVCSSFRMYGKPCLYELMLVSKRGNEVYSAKVRSRFKPLSFLCELNRKNDISFLQSTKVKNFFHGSFLWVTLTYDTNLCSIDTAWSNVGQELNQYLASIRQKYGRISVLRNYEAFTNGYPHSHLLIYFHEHDFLIKKWFNPNKKPKPDYEYIVVSKSQGHGGKLTQDKTYLHHYWHSFVKCTAVKDLGAVGYTLKYLTKDMYHQSNYSTSANLWLYHKQSYSMSQDFVSTVSELCDIPLLDYMSSNSNTLKYGKSFWTILGSYVSPYQYEKWHVRPKKPPDWDKFEKSDFETSDVLGSWVGSGLSVLECKADYSKEVSSVDYDNSYNSIRRGIEDVRNAKKVN